MAKLFVAVDLPLAVRERLACIVPPGTAGLRVVRPDALHLTLHYIGEAEPASHVAALSRVRADAFDLRLQNLGWFPNEKRPRVLWMGVERSKPLATLHQRVGEALGTLGFTPDTRGFAPHVTLARVVRAVPRALKDGLPASDAGDWPALRITEFTLYSSRALDGRPHYHAEGTFPLG